MALTAAAPADAATASWSFEPTSFNFGTRSPEEGISEPRPFILANTGEATLEPAFFALIPGRGGEFKLKANSCHEPLEPGHSCVVGVAFAPTGAGEATATLEVSERHSAAPPAVATLTGTGAAPVAGVEPRELLFGPTRLGGSSPAQVVTVTNVGSSDLAFSEFTVSPSLGDGRDPFEFTHLGCYAWTVLAPGESCSETVVFLPRAVGLVEGELTFFDDAIGSPQTVKLSGTGEPEPPPVGLTVDKTPPSAATMSRKPGRRTRDRTAIFAFAGDATTTGFQCGLGGGPLVSTCRSPVRYRKLDAGSHLFRVRPVAGDGVPGPIITYRWRILR
ncbi:MAG TPA: choice-of-anchor D domain-containing protein [Solirubrobacterales bacterium]|jgi:hypothetical protein|nr:choice-of-anchor D domain-containing protein [Solirubrobacterales bacterium]